MSEEPSQQILLATALLTVLVFVVAAFVAIIVADPPTAAEPRAAEEQIVTNCEYSGCGSPHLLEITAIVTAAVVAFTAFRRWFHGT